MSGAPDSLRRALREARSICVLTGAGVSAESGVPTFRDALTGLWSKFDPAQLATPEAFARDPQLVTRWYDERRQLRLTTKPNAGHHALVTLEKKLVAEGRGFLLATQNVDRLHHTAGAERVVELHGSLMVWRCIHCHEEREELGPAFTDHPPRCHCGGMRRPAVTWFGEILPEHALRASVTAAATCELFITVGTSGVVYPAAGLIDIALQQNTPVLEVNPDPTPFTDRATWSIRGKSGEVLPGLVEEAVG